METEYGQWYKFRYVDDFMHFVACYGVDPDEWIAQHGFTKYAMVDYTGIHMSDRDEGNMGKIITYHRECMDTNNIIVEDNKMDNKLTELVLKYKTEKHKLIEDDCVQVMNDVFNNTAVGSIVNKALDEVKKLVKEDETVHILDNWKDEFKSPRYLTEEEYKKFEDLRDRYNQLHLELDKNMDTLLALLSVTDTYEQKECLLIKYHVIGE